MTEPKETRQGSVGVWRKEKRWEEERKTESDRSRTSADANKKVGGEQRNEEESRV